MLPFRPLLLASAAMSAALSPWPVTAQAAADPVDATLPAVTVRGAAETATSPVNGYRARRAVSATKTDTPLSETPQSITIVTRDQMVDQGASNLQDALNYAAGVRSDAYGLDSRSDGVRVRGAYPDEYLDGLRKTNGYYTSTGRTEPYTLERIEVLRGPAAMLFGQGSTAGVVNMVSKRPLAERQNEIGVQVGNFGRRQLQADLTGPLSADGQWLYRLVAVGRESDTQVDQVADDRRLIAPSLTWRPNAATSLTLQALYQKDHTGSTSQFLPWTGTLLPSPAGLLPSSTFIGQPGDRYDTRRRTLGYWFEHRFDSGWTVRQNVRVARNDVEYVTAYGDSFSAPGDWAVDPVNKRLITRYGAGQRTQVNTLNADQHLDGTLHTGAVEHQLLGGLDFARFKTTGAATATSVLSAIDAYQPVYVSEPLGDYFASAPNTMRQTGVYLQDQMKIDRRWIVVAGLRHDRVSNHTEGSLEEKTSATSKRLGLMHRFDSGWSPYVSYSESFTPQSNIIVSTGTGSFSQSFAPLRGKQLEAGVKYEPEARALAFNASVYDLREKNRITAPLPGVYQQLGSTKTRGVELEARGTVAGTLDLIGHYNYTDLDDQLEGMPRHTASAWAKQRFALGTVGGFSAGAGVRWLGHFTDRSGGMSGPEMPMVTLLDALLAYDTPSWRLALNVNNLTDRRYFGTCLSRGDCWYGARRTVVATATYRF